MTVRRLKKNRPEIWQALGRGALLRTILEDFYARVYADERMAPFFAHTTLAWAIDHQFAFLSEIFSGEKVYFGDRPRNAHHWMVISDELFDHREALMDQCLRDHGLAEVYIREWRAIEETFRSHIVKDRPFARKRNGAIMPLEGHERIDFVAGGQCDRCQGEVPIGATGWFHVRTGHAYCAACAELLGLPASSATPQAAPQ